MGALLDLVLANTPNERNERNERTSRAGSLATAPGDLHRPLRADHELAELLGLEGSRQQFIGAADLVAHFSGKAWRHDDALDALARWWGRDVESLSPVQWIVSAAYADEVQRAYLNTTQTEATMNNNDLTKTPNDSADAHEST